MIVLKKLNVNDILHWEFDNNHMLGKVDNIVGNDIVINWYYDSDVSPIAQEELNLYYEIDMNFSPGWLEYTNVISEKENLIFLLSRK